MIIRRFFAACFAVCLSTAAFAADWVKSDLGETAVIPMKNAPYPDDSRKDGFKKGDKEYSFAEHYNDSSVLLFIPAGYKAGEKTDVLLYFHGWNNNVRKAADVFKLREQITGSKKNVILVFPQGPKDVPDEEIGKLEQKDGFKKLLDEVMQTLKDEKKTPSTTLGRVIISGHSGGYLPIGECLKHGGVEEHLSEVYLIDAAYGYTDEFAGWATRNKTGRLVSVNTDHLQKKNENIMAALKAANVPYEARMDTEVDDAFLKSNRIVFQHTTTLTHDQTVGLLEKFLRTGTLTDRPQAAPTP